MCLNLTAFLRAIPLIAREWRVTRSHRLSTADAMSDVYAERIEVSRIELCRRKPREQLKEPSFDCARKRASKDGASFYQRDSRRPPPPPPA
jgi:hypothetical protein